MTNLKILSWLSLVILILFAACADEPDEIPPIRVVVSSTTCAEGDTLAIEVTQSNNKLTGVSWNQPSVQATQTGYRLIVPTISSDTTTLNLIASYNNQTDVVKLTIFKRAFREPRVSYAQFIVPLFEQNCNFSGCHGNGSHGGKIELSTYDSVYRFVKPYNAAGSIVYQAIINPDPLTWMPPAGKLHADKIEKFRLWIEQGATNQ